MMSANGVARISAEEMKEAVKAGFNPFKTAGIHMADAGVASSFGMTKEQMFKDWHQRVLTDPAEWRVCLSCAEVYKRSVKHIIAHKERDYNALFESILRSGLPASSALKKFEKEIAADPNTAEKFFWLGVAYMVVLSVENNIAYLDRSILFFEEALKIDPKHKNTYARLFKAYLHKKDHHSVRKTAKKWAEIDPAIPQEVRQWLKE
jgi:tetratricopeptide (TPR) repeat protein